MNIGLALLFLFSTLAAATLMVVAAQYYFQTRNEALDRRLEELQQSSMSGGATAFGDGDFWEMLLHATYGTVFGRGWFRDTEMTLLRAGIRGREALKAYGVGSLALTLILVLSAWAMFRTAGGFTLLLAIAGALIFGYFIPEQILHMLRSRHRASLLSALPDTTDMLSIVLGAGLSLDQAIARVSDEIRFAYPELADEFYWMTLEVQAGQERAVAFQHMALRTGLTDIRSLAGMIAQAERFGTGLSQALRIYADSLRTKRKLAIEEKINKVAVKMIIPIVLFIMPALFVVVLVPGVLSFLRDIQLLG
jgi:tight adherence protein C